MSIINALPASEPTVAYLGPRGTFSEEIALSFYRGVEGCFTPYERIDAVIRAVADGEAAEGIVPVENSLDGSVNITLDTLAHEVDLRVVKEMVLPIRHNLLARADTKHINVILSHPQALAQCRNYLREHYPGAELVAVESTAAAAYQVASGAKNTAAIGSLRAARLYNLAVPAVDIQDNPNNSTRFIVLARDAAAPAGPNCKTSVICQINGEKPGSLYEILGEFARRQVNLTKIESRPARTGLGLYIFFLDAEGSLEDGNVRAAVEAVRERSIWFKSLGSYPICLVKHKAE
ncbi:prephenate dehydratase [Anaeroselena agilis]|uniref:Prephenate dehydratase n=1 Tax=Anaeroselena agilis TaxID=3063788 RepID=A0ABU3NXB3_9FIRM|nr:prephenate dehydratase [Selenomonadales bacterium 4137-cl]